MIWGQSLVGAAVGLPVGMKVVGAMVEGEAVGPLVRKQGSG